MKRLKLLACCLSIFLLFTVTAYANPNEGGIDQTIVELTASAVEEPPAPIEPQPSTNGGVDETELQKTYALLLALDGTCSNLASDVNAILGYVEFFLFGVLPLTICVIIIVAGCVWFRKVFIRM